MEKASKLVTLLNCEDRKAAKKVDAAAAAHTHQRLHYLWSEKYVDTYFDVLNTRSSIPTAGLAAGWYVSMMPLRQSGARVFVYTRRNSVFLFFFFF